MATSSDFTLSVFVSAVDGITKPIQAINKSIASINKPVERIRNSFRRLARAARLPEMSRRLANVGTSFNSLKAKSVSMARSAVLAFGTLGTLAFGVVNKIAMLGDATAKTADILGVSAVQWGRWQFAAERSGIQATAFSGVILKMQKAVSLAAGDANSSTAQLFKALNITLKDTEGNLKSTPVLFNEIADATAKMPDKLKRNAVLMELMGRSGAQMATLLQGGSKGIEELGDEAERLGVVMSESFVRRSEVFQDRLTNVTSALQGLAFGITAGLLPKINDMLKGFTAWIQANKSIMRTGIGEFVRGMTTTFRSFANSVNNVAQMIAKALNISIVDSDGKLKSLSSTIGSIINSLGGLERIGQVVAGLFLLKFSVSVASLAFSFLGVIKAIGLFVGALVTSPISIYIAVIAALAGIATLVVRNWEPIKAFFSGVWSSVTESFNSFISFIAGTSLFQSGIQIFQTFFDGMSESWSLITDLWGGIFLRIDAFIEELFGFSLIDVGSDLINGFLDGMKAGWSSLTGWLGSAIDSIANIIPDSIKSFFGFGGEQTTIKAPVVTPPTIPALSPRRAIASPFQEKIRTPAESILSPRVPTPTRLDTIIGSAPRNVPTTPEKLQGNIVVEFMNAPVGTRVTRAATTGTTDVDIDTGLTFATP